MKAIIVIEKLRKVIKSLTELNNRANELDIHTIKYVAEVNVSELSKIEGYLNKLYRIGEFN